MIGQRIAALRRESNMSQSELAARLGVSSSAVGMYEQCRREPSVETIIELSRIFDVTTDYLLTGKPTAAADADALKRILEGYVSRAEERLKSRTERPFSREELIMVIASLLGEP